MKEMHRSSPAQQSGLQKSGTQLNELFVEERKKGVLDISQIPGAITAHEPGYIDQPNEVDRRSAN